jgi:hypothetical protein
MRSPSIQVNPQKYIGEKECTLNVRFGSLGVVHTHFSRMAALGWKVDVQAGQMSAFTDTGRSDALRNADLNGS